MIYHPARKRMDQYQKPAASRIRNIDLKSLKKSDNIIFTLEKQIMTCRSIWIIRAEPNGHLSNKNELFNKP
jgi:hypothetical protein